MSTNTNIQEIDNDEKIQLSGFPPILFINNETKKKREFKKKWKKVLKMIIQIN